MTFALFTNLVLTGLCIAVIMQGSRMMRGIQSIKSGELGTTIGALDNATAQAHKVLAELKEVLSTDAVANARTIQSGESLRDELSVMVGIGNAVADRIIEASSAATEAQKVAHDIASAGPDAGPGGVAAKRTRRRQGSEGRDGSVDVDAAPIAPRAPRRTAPTRSGLH